MAYLEYIKDGENLTLELLRDREYYVGRDLACTIAFPEYPDLELRHSVIYFNSNAGAFMLGDMNSGAGTSLNGTPIGHTEKLLADGDVISAGSCTLRFRVRNRKYQADAVASSNTSKLRVLARRPLESPRPAVREELPDGPCKVGERFGDCVVTDILMENELQILCLLREVTGKTSPDGAPLRKVLNIYKDHPRDFSAGRELTNTIQNLPSGLEGILPYQESGTLDNGLCFYTTEFLDAPSFAKIISVSAPMEESRVLPRVYAVAQILDNAASRGVIHGQLTPAKILYCPRKRDQIIGMGLSAWRRKYYDVGSYPSLWYASPEHYGNGELSWKADLYSLGIMMFQMVSGVLPFRSDDPLELARMHCHEPLPGVAERNSRVRISRQFFSVLIRMTMKDPGDRYGSWRDFMKDLSKVSDYITQKNSV